MPGDPVHEAAAEGYARASAIYVRGRPDYPPAVTDWLRESAGLGPDRLAVELGAGTGKFLPTLRASGARIVAVEPVSAMRAQLAAANPDIAVRAGDAQAIPVEDGTAEAVICAQSFHWFATRAALDEVARILKPGGVLSLIWNVRDESVDWVAALSRITNAHQGDAPRYHSGRWRAAFPHPAFVEADERRLRHEHIGSPEAVIVDRTLSVSFIAALGEAERDVVAAEVRALIAATPTLAGRDEVCFPYRTDMFAFRRL